MTLEVELNGARALVTGGAGFVGSHIVEQLVAAGAARVLVLDDLIRGRRENLHSVSDNAAVEIIEGDICDASLMDQACAGNDYVFHQAALRITQCAEDPVRAVRVMIEGTQNVLEAAVRHRVAKVMLASSASVYGEPDRLPIQESDAFNNRTIYGAAKIANEQMARAYAEMYGLRYIALRPFNVYGPRMDAFGAYTEVMIRWLERLARGEAPVIFGDGAQTMDFVYVADVARAYLLAATSDAVDDVLNAGSGIETSLKELCRMLCQESGHPDLEPIYTEGRKVNGVTRRCAATEHARETIGFEARVGLRDGLRELVDWYASLADTERVAV
ncbi:MAG TPA: NAD-dependent epimerase/dehydratase family protein [Candidatus Micrarchaeaceae archaeon]|nr:NAD-dependent epimerase/dehydratase family protein [Candidatus Micrarchaeaceae archaeon]